MSQAFKGFLIFAVLMLGMICFVGEKDSYVEDEVIPLPPVQVDSVPTVEMLVHILTFDGEVRAKPRHRRIAEIIHGTTYWFDDIDAEMVARLVRVESSVDSLAVSSVGAVGLGQIRPSVWKDVFPQCGTDLFRVRDNICYTVHILSDYQKRSPTLRHALLSYNGCRSAHCSGYPSLISGDFAE